MHFIHVENALDGDALVASIDHGPDSLKEAIPSLGKRSKLFQSSKKHFSDQQVLDILMCSSLV